MTDAFDMSAFEAALAETPAPKPRKKPKRFEIDPNRDPSKPLASKPGDYRVETYDKEAFDKALRANEAGVEVSDIEAIDSVQNRQRGSSAGSRAVTGAKYTNAGAINNLRAEWGEQNVRPIINKDGDLINAIITDPKTGETFFHDPPPDDLKSFLKDLPGDMFLDTTNPAAQALASAVGTVIAGRYAGGPKSKIAMEAVADAFGSAAGQALSAMFPGDDELTWNERLAAAGFDVAAGFGTGLAQRKIAGGLRRAPIPKAIGGSGVKRSTRDATEVARMLGRDFGEESLTSASGRSVREEIERAGDQSRFINENMPEGSRPFRWNAAQASGANNMAQLHNALSQTPGYSNKIVSSRNLQLRAYDQHLATLTDKIAENPDLIDPSSLGGSLLRVTNKKLDALKEIRSQQAGVFLKKFDDLTQKPVFESAPITDALDGLATKWRLGLGSEVSTIRRLQGLLGKATDKNGRMTGDDVLTLLHEASELAAAKHPLEGLSRGRQRMLARTIYDSVDEALEKTMTEKGVRGIDIPDDAITNLKGFREAWKIGSQAIDEFKAGPISKFLKDIEPEDAFKQFQRMNPRQVKGLMAVADELEPELASDLRAGYLRDLLSEKAGHAADTLDADMIAPAFSPRKAKAAILKNAKTLRAVFGGNSEHMGYLTRTMENMDRLAFAPVKEGSDTHANQAAIRSLVRNFSGLPPAVTDQINKVIGEVGKRGAFQEEVVYRIMNHPEGAEAMHALFKSAYDASYGTGAFAKKAANSALKAGMQIFALTQRDDIMQGFGEMFDVDEFYKRQNRTIDVKDPDYSALPSWTRQPFTGQQEAQ